MILAPINWFTDTAESVYTGIVAFFTEKAAKVPAEQRAANVVAIK